MISRSTLAADRTGVTTVEFALVAPVLLMVLFMMFGICLLLWTSAAIQTAASQLARCSVIGSSACTGGNQLSYVNAILTNWGVSAIFTPGTPVVQANSPCSGTVGKFTSVTISGAGYQALFIGLPSKTLTASACFPSST